MVAKRSVIGGRYQLGDELGRGGMGIVYLGYDLLTQRKIALKIMTGYPEDIQKDQKAREKFRGEIQIAKELNHENVLRALDSGETVLNNRKLPYLVSEYLPEGSLQELITKRHPWEHWTFTQIVDIIMQAAQGLWYLHTHIPII